MRIIGGRDYYDNARAFGSDSQIVFNRTQTEKSELFSLLPFVGERWLPEFERKEKLRGVPYWKSRYVHGKFDSGKYSHTLDFVIVIFAGKLYRGLRHDIYTTPMTRHHFWSDEKAYQTLDDLGLVYRRGYDNQPFPKLGCHDLTKTQTQYLIDNRISIAIDADWADVRYKKERWRIDTDGLKDVDFAKIVDPFQAFQELSMWVGGVLPQMTNPIVELLGEDIMLAKHGMDGMSFKKYPSKTK